MCVGLVCTCYHHYHSWIRYKAIIYEDRHRVTKKKTLAYHKGYKEYSTDRQECETQDDGVSR